MLNKKMALKKPYDKYTQQMDKAAGNRIYVDHNWILCIYLMSLAGEGEEV